jgi:hypothetical protein
VEERLLGLCNCEEDLQTETLACGDYVNLKYKKLVLEKDMSFEMDKKRYSGGLCQS